MLRFVLMTIVLAGLIKGLLMYGSSRGLFSMPSFANEILIFLVVSTIGIYRFVVRKFALPPIDFVKIYLGATVLRILFFGGFIFALIRLDAESANGNAAFFLVCYFLFTALEVVILFREINFGKPANKGQKDT